jgi:hypothetical protein
MLQVGSTSYITHLTKIFHEDLTHYRVRILLKMKMNVVLRLKKEILKERAGKIGCFSKSTNNTI